MWPAEGAPQSLEPCEDTLGPNQILTQLLPVLPTASTSVRCQLQWPARKRPLSHPTERQVQT